MELDYFLGLSEEGFHRVVYSHFEGNKTNLPIICVHGLTRNRSDFDDLAAYLNHQGYPVFCPDIVGRGDSDWLKNPLHYTYEQYIQDMAALIARIHTDKVNWIGTSMGGLLGLFLAAQRNTPIAKLVLNDIGPQIPAKGIARLAKYTGKEPEFANIGEATTYFKSIYAGLGNLTEAQWTNIAKKGTHEAAPGRIVSKLDPGIKIIPAKSKLAWQALMHPLKALQGSFFDVNLWHLWNNVKCPVLVIHGRSSDLLTPAIIKKMQHSHVDLEVFEVHDAGHAPALLDPAHHKLIYNWLKKS